MLFLDFFTLFPPRLSSADYQAQAANASAVADCSTAWYNGAVTARGDIPSADYKKSCMFWHVNIHSCPAVDPDGKAAFCTPYMGKTTAGGVALATHSPAQSWKGTYENGNIVQRATFTTEVKSVTSNSQDFTTIAHFKFGVSPNSVSIAAGWAHKINSFSYKTSCPTGFVPNPDSSCAVCPSGKRAYAPTISGTPAVNRTLAYAAPLVDAGTTALSAFALANFCVECSRGSFTGEKVPKSTMAADSCTLCPLGTYQSLTNQKTCLPCAVGHYADNLGQDVCFPCPKGTYQPLTAQSSCLPAPDGEYVDLRGQTTTKTCPHASMTTDGVGRQSAGECVCPQGEYMVLGAYDDQGKCGLRANTWS